jgi:transcriptional regulator with XRE-family HTH domain
MLTNFGVLLKTHMLKTKNSSQGAFANALGCSPSQLSLILNGKKDPDIEFLIRCREYFNLNNEETIAFFKVAFSSSKNVTINMDYFLQSNKEMFIDALSSLLLYPKLSYLTADDIKFREAIKIMTDVIRGKNTLNPMRKDNEKNDIIS